MYSYDSEGNLIEEVLYYPRGDSVKFRLTHTYDPRGHRTETICWDAHGPGLGIGDTVQKYDARGNVEESITYYTGRKAGDKADLGDFVPYEMITTYKFNSNGDITEQSTRDTRRGPEDKEECGYSPCRTVYVYEYDAKGNWTKQSEFSCIPDKFGKYECQELEGETNRTITYYPSGTK